MLCSHFSSSSLLWAWAATAPLCLPLPMPTIRLPTPCRWSGCWPTPPCSRRSTLPAASKVGPTSPSPSKRAIPSAWWSTSANWTAPHWSKPPSPWPGRAAVGKPPLPTTAARCAVYAISTAAPTAISPASTTFLSG